MGSTVAKSCRTVGKSEWRRDAEAAVDRQVRESGVVSAVTRARLRVLVAS